jgi:putative nucleotidyltransferase with HDIG domain
MGKAAKTYVGAVATVGLSILVFGLIHWHCADPTRFLGLLSVALATSLFKVSLPGIPGTMSMSYIFVMLGIAQLSLGETLLLGTGATLLQSFWRCKRRPTLVQLIFNISVIWVVIGAAHVAFHWSFTQSLLPRAVTRIFVAAAVYFLVNTVAVAAVIALTEKLSLPSVWKDSYLWSFPYYLLGASMVGVVELLGSIVSMEMVFLALPVAYVAFRSYRLHLESLIEAKNRAEEEKRHAEEMAALHLRTIRVLALAIEAKDATTGAHLHRVQTYAMEIGKELGLGVDELKALSAAALLHDIGKIAVPEHIISKPGRLNKEEFEKVKIHPVVGAEIVESVRFPYDVATIVRGHHEKWDGLGYPSGLKGEEIPIGARILSAVDCLDALASDRQYRRAFPMEKAIQMVVLEAGRSFDPRVIEVLQRRAQDFEKLAQATAHEESVRFSIDTKIRLGLAPDAGYAIGFGSTEAQGGLPSRPLAARLEEEWREATAIEQLNAHLPSPSGLTELLICLESELQTLLQFDCLAFFLKEGEWLQAVFARGRDAAVFSNLRTPVGTGASGWVAENRTPLLNGDAATETGDRNQPPVAFGLRSALAVPVEFEGGILGVLSLYSTTKDAFQDRDLRTLLAIRSKVSYAVATAIRGRQARQQAGDDPVTSLPNAAALLCRLDAQIRSLAGSHAPLLLVMGEFVAGRLSDADVGILFRHIAEVVRIMDPGDAIVARPSPHEIAIALPGSGLERSDQVRAAIAQAWASISPSVEVASGVRCGSAVYPDDGCSPELLIAVASSRLTPVTSQPRAEATTSADLIRLGQVTAYHVAKEVH